MARIGMNPARGQETDYRPARVTVAVLVHLPHLTGYHEHRFPVVQACLQSLLENTSVEHDLLVLDNASCAEMRQYLKRLQSGGFLRYLIHSDVNLGKLGGLRMLLQAAPGEVVAYCDDDFYLEPGWLEAHLQVLDTFPNVGMVSGYVLRSFYDEARISSNLEFAHSEPEAQLVKGDFVPESLWRRWAESTGRDPDEVVRQFQAREDLLLEYKGLQAFAAANHDQFVGPKSALIEALPDEWSGRLMGEMLEFDQRLNELGYLRLATREQTSEHIGNALSPELARKAGDEGNETVAPRVRGRARSVKARILRWGPVRSLLLGLYSRLFRLLNPD